MASVNKVTVLGNLGRDPEVKYAPSGSAVCNISVATTSSWKDKTTGEKKEETEWHRCVAYGRSAEVIGEYLKKGSSIYLEGHLKTRKWQDKDTGADRYATEIVIDNFQMLGGKADSDGRDTNNGGSQRPAQSRPAQQQSRPAAQPASNAGGYDDDIPF